MVDEVMSGRQPELAEEDWERVRLAKYFARYAQGAYGWPLFVFDNPCRGVFGCQACGLGCGRPGGFIDCGYTFPRGVLNGSGCCDALCLNSSAKAFLTHTGLRAEDILHANIESRYGTVSYFVAVDEKSGRLVIAVRGTMSLADTVTDLDARMAYIPCAPSYYAHKGILVSAEWLMRELDGASGWSMHGFLRDRAARGRPLSLLLTGHSLGAGVATLLTVLLARQYPSLQCVAFAPPLCVDPALAEKMRDAVTSISYRYDLISRLSLVALFRLKKQIMNAFKVCAGNKFQIFRASLDRRHGDMFDRTRLPPHWRFDEGFNDTLFTAPPRDIHQLGVVSDSEAEDGSGVGVGGVGASGRPRADTAQSRSKLRRAQAKQQMARSRSGTLSANGNNNSNANDIASGSGSGSGSGVASGVTSSATSPEFAPTVPKGVTVMSRGGATGGNSSVAMVSLPSHEQQSAGAGAGAGVSPIVPEARLSVHGHPNYSTLTGHSHPNPRGGGRSEETDSDRELALAVTEMTEAIALGYDYSDYAGRHTAGTGAGDHGDDGEFDENGAALGEVGRNDSYESFMGAIEYDPHYDYATSAAALRMNNSNESGGTCSNGSDRNGNGRNTSDAVPVPLGDAAGGAASPGLVTDAKDAGYIARTALAGRIYHLMPSTSSKGTWRKSFLGRVVLACLCLRCCFPRRRTTVVYPAHRQMFDELYISASSFTDHFPKNTHMEDLDIPDVFFSE